MYRQRLEQCKRNNRLSGYVEPIVQHKEPEIDPVQQMQIQEYENAGEQPPPELLKTKRKRKYLPGERLLIRLNKEREELPHVVKKRSDAPDIKALSKGISRMVMKLT